jgi:hypothetical protein
VYDLRDFIGGDHSDIANTPSNSKDYTEQLGGSDMTYYFQPPLVLACPGLVDDAQMALSIKNTSQLAIPYAVSVSVLLLSLMVVELMAARIAGPHVRCAPDADDEPEAG